MFRIIIILLSLILFAIIILYLKNENIGDEKKKNFIEITSVLSSNEDNSFQKAIEKRMFAFPEDFYPKTDFRNEWWYFTGNLESKDGRQFGYQFTIFRNSLINKNIDSKKWESNEIYMCHFAISDIEQDKFYSYESLSRGLKPLAFFDSMEKKINVEINYFKFDYNPSKKQTNFKIYSSAKGIELELSLESKKPIVLQGEDGLSQKSSARGNASYYFSITKLKTTGRIKIKDNEFYVTGYSWFDREWSTSSLDTNQVGWDWFSLQLNNNYELMFYALRERDGSFDEVSSGNIIHPDGSVEKLKIEQVKLTIQNYWTNPDGIKYPAAWKFEIPDKNTILFITPLMNNQEHRLSFRYWEGTVSIKGKLKGSDVSGKGYVELTGYK